ncbi:hypothetical protein QN345_00465 [Cryobacterium sp. 10I1]|uniref:LamG-like jellyroll fold domain-containing protein n=1 Tax=Cryobacterium sp. 10I1 TaxID=3048578 RepID=UPI002B22BFB4|nr:LamG-like jellyroll fold domain-containing protein [Cryobacterium sp. 10I1]MEB0303812.1 hypothetical protein [Cryobacterium sp. 10I1]
MQTGPAGFDAALAALTPLTISTAVNLGSSTLDATNSTGFGSSVKVTRILSGELPSSATNIVGGQSATVEIIGDSRIAGAPNPISSADQSAWLGAPVSVSAGYGGLTVPVYSGTVSALGTLEGARRSTVDGRDGAGKLTTAVQLPPYGAQTVRGAVGSPTQHYTNTSAVITNILHKNGIRMTPAPRQSCVLSLPGVGGWLADVGWVIPLSGASPTSYLEAGRFGMAPKSTGEYMAGIPATECVFSSIYLHQVEFWYKHDGADRSEVVFMQTTLGGSIKIDITSNEALLWVRRTGAYSPYGVASSGTMSTGWHHIAFEVSYGTRARMWLDGAAVFDNTTSWGSNTPYPSDIAAVKFFSGRIQGLNYCYGTTLTPPDTSIMSFTPEADVSLGAFDLTAIPNVDGQNSWTVLKDIAAAELGMVGFSESGRFFFKNRAELAASTTPVATWGLDLLAELSTSASVDSILTRATATVKRTAGVYSGYGNSDPLTTAIPSALADQVFTIPLSGSSVLLTGSAPFLPTTTVVSMITAASGAWNTPVGMAVCYDAAGSSLYTGPDVRAWITPVSQTVWRINFWNNSGAVLYTAWPAAWTGSGGVPFDRNAGSPAFWVNGYSFPPGLIADAPVNRVNGAALATWGDRVLTLGDSVWRQNVTQVEAFADAILATTSRPHAQIDDVTVPADPRWQIGDPVTIHDDRGRLPDFTARITSIELTISLEVEGGMVGKYGLRQI